MKTSPQPKLYIFGKQKNLRRAPDCLLRPMAHPDWIILQRIQSLSFCESLKYQKTLMAFQKTPVKPKKTVRCSRPKYIQAPTMFLTKSIEFLTSNFWTKKPSSFRDRGLLCIAKNNTIQVSQVNDFFLEHNNLSVRNYGAKFYGYQINTAKVLPETVPKCQNPPTCCKCERNP